jgi:hypothetical protein
MNCFLCWSVLVENFMVKTICNIVKLVVYCLCDIYIPVVPLCCIIVSGTRSGAWC